MPSRRRPPRPPASFVTAEAVGGPRARAALVLAVLCFSFGVHAQYACPTGWTLFANDGVEGHDSCIKLFTTGLAYTAANTACGTHGGHLITYMNTGQGGLSATAAGLASGTFTIGCSQTASATTRGTAWTWIDGTDAANINCGTGLGAQGCNLWGTGYPRCVWRGSRLNLDGSFREFLSTERGGPRGDQLVL